MDARILASVRERGLAPNIKEILIACYDQIVARRVISLSDLIAYLGDLEWQPALEKVVRRCFTMIREMHWGVFKSLDRAKHPELWKALTVPCPLVLDLGDLKRSIAVPDIYCGLVDIHAYTEFCERHRHNASMLRTLDDLIQKDTSQLAARHRCLSCRSSGDTIIVIGPSAGDVIRTCLGIIDAFSRKRVLREETSSVRRSGNTVVLQDLHVSAGIAGGRQYSSLIVTEDGDVSGSVVNTAARLQVFAAAVCPDQSKVMVTSYVYSRYRSDAERKPRTEMDRFTFFNCGKIGFKGVEVSVHEILYTDKDSRKTTYQKQYDELLAVVEKRVWKDRLVPDVLKLVMTVLQTAPVPRIEVVHEGRKETHTNANLIALCDRTIDTYSRDQDHRETGRALLHVLAALERAVGFDPLVLFHFREIAVLFDRMAREYESLQYERIISNQLGLFSKEERRLMNDIAQLEKVRDRLIERSKRVNNVYSPTALWSQVVSGYERAWEFEFYSGKR